MNKSEFTEDWIPIKSILNGMIQTDDGMIVAGIKIQPSNIFILEAYEQVNVINALRNFYNSMDFEFWLIVTDRPVDIHVYLAELELLYKESTNPASRKIIMEDMEKANAFMGSEYNVVDTEYYILFKEKRVEMIQKRLRDSIGAIAGAGLNATQASNNDLRMIIDNFLNGEMNTTYGTVVPK